MRRRDAFLLPLLSAIWGSSFLFIKLGVETLEPSVVVLGCLVFGGLFLAALLPGRGGLEPLRGHLFPLVVLGALTAPSSSMRRSNATALIGLALVLSGTALATGLARASRSG